MRHVLIVCYDFPRISAAGVIRIYQFAKRLPEFGWQPVILTAQSPDEKREDNIEISDGELPCPKITVTASRFAVPIHTDHCAAADAVRSNGDMTGLARFAAGVAVPDGKIGWLISAVNRGVQIAREYAFGACFSVSPRPTAHFVAYRIARRLKIPWIADFALPWSDAYWLGNRPRLLKRIDRKLEKLIVRSAHRVTVAYPELGRRLGARHGHACADKISVIPTGFDEDLFREPEPPAQAKFAVVYPGNHFCESGRDGEYFLRTIDEWLDAKPELQEHVEFVFIGKRDEELLQQRADMVHSNVVRVEPLMSHRASVQMIRSSHMCVVNTVGNRIPAKVYECMRAGKWILALTNPGSDLENLIRDYSKGLPVPAHDTSAIRNALQSTFQQISSDQAKRSEADRSLHIYSSFNQGAEMISRLFDMAVTQRQVRE
jgi:glycosyltransferase involved in cell wall biosynthesis